MFFGVRPCCRGASRLVSCKSSVCSFQLALGHYVEFFRLALSHSVGLFVGGFCECVLALRFFFGVRPSCTSVCSFVLPWR